MSLWDLKEIKRGPYTILPQEGEVLTSRQRHKLQPKHMQVLLLLLEQEGEVVSLDEIHHTVWSDVHVSANTLQRCIANIRSAFEDDAKNQAVIQTFPKRGYRFQVLLEPRPKNRLVHALWAIPILLIGVIYFLGHLPQSPRLEIMQLEPLGVSFGNESSAVYAPHQPWVAFLRDEEHCEKSLWVKDLNTHIEVRLPVKSQGFTNLEWSEEGVLAFQSQSCIEEPLPCNRVGLFFFETQLEDPVFLDLTDMIPSQLGRFDWQGEDLVFIDNNPPGLLFLNWRRADFRFHPFPSHQYLFDVEVHKGTPYVLGRKGKSLELVKKVGNVTRLIQSDLLGEPSHFTDWSLKVHQELDWILISSGNRNHFFQVDGTPLPANVYAGLSMYPSDFHRIEPKLLGSLALMDWDVVEHGWSSNHSQETRFGTSASEYFAKYSPHEGFAMTSERTGTAQIWVFDGEILRVLSTFPAYTTISSLAWSMDGGTVFAVVDEGLVALEVQTKQEKRFHQLSQVKDILQVLPEGLLLRVWDGDEYLLLMWQPESMDELYRGPFEWAQKWEDEIFISVEHNLFRVQESEWSSLASPGEPRKVSKFYVRGEYIFTQWDQNLYKGAKDGKSVSWQDLQLTIPGKFMDVNPKKQSVLFANLIRQDRNMVQVHLKSQR